MADRFSKLSKVLRGVKVRGKVPTERPGSRAHKRVFDTFERSAQAIFQQSLIGGAERQERFRDYEEMDQSPEISKALDIYADDSCTYSEEGDVIKIISDDEKLKAELEELYYERLDIEFHLWTWIRNLTKYGDQFNLLDVVDKEGVVGAIALPTLEIDREEGYNGDPNSVRYKWTVQGNTYFENFQISHMRILGDDRFLPYGRSVLEPARKIYKQLTMAEDAMLVYRMTRAPERRVFYIEVGNIPPKDVESYIMKARDSLKRTPLMTESTGNVDMRYNPQSIDEDFFIPVRGDRGTRVETLPGGTNQGDIEDIEYLQNKMFIALGVPKSYLTAEEDLGGKGTLAQEDIKFARTIQRVQKIVISELAKIGLIHLYLKGYDEKDIYNFDLSLTNPSTVMEMMQLDLIEKRFSLASTIQDSPLIDDLYIQRTVLNLTDSEITQINGRILTDAHKRFVINTLENEGTNPATGVDSEEGEMSDEDKQSGIDNLPTENDETKEDREEKETLSHAGKTPTGVPDPTGTANIPGAPKGYGIHDSSLMDSETFKKKRAKSRKDPLDRTISDCMKADRKIKRLIESISGSDALTEDVRKDIHLKVANTKKTRK